MVGIYCNIFIKTLYTNMSIFSFSQLKLNIIFNNSCLNSKIKLVKKLRYNLA